MQYLPWLLLCLLLLTTSLYLSLNSPHNLRRLRCSATPWCPGCRLILRRPHGILWWRWNRHRLILWCGMCKWRGHWIGLWCGIGLHARVASGANESTVSSSGTNLWGGAGGLSWCSNNTWGEDLEAWSSLMKHWCTWKATREKSSGPSSSWLTLLAKFTIVNLQRTRTQDVKEERHKLKLNMLYALSQNYQHCLKNDMIKCTKHDNFWFGVQFLLNEAPYFSGLEFGNIYKMASNINLNIGSQCSKTSPGVAQNDMLNASVDFTGKNQMPYEYGPLFVIISAQYFQS